MDRKPSRHLGRPRKGPAAMVPDGDARGDHGSKPLVAIILLLVTALNLFAGLTAASESGGPNGTVGRIANPSYKHAVLSGPLRQDRGGGAARLPTLAITQLPAGARWERQAGSCAGTLRAPYGSGARIVLWAPSFGMRLVAPGFHSAADPDISFDGKRILFAGKRTASARWAIYEMTIATGEIRQITRERGDCRAPSYQGPMYAITEDAPWHQITFVETLPGVLNECGAGRASALYSCKLDGTFVQRLTYNLSSDYDPAIMPDGRLVFASWQRAGLDHGPAGRIALLGVNTDGIDLAPFCVNAGRRIKHMPCVTTGGLVVFVEADSAPWDGAGMLSCVSLRRPLHSYRRITTAADGLFHSPSPLPDGRILVSRRPADGSGTHAVYVMDLASKRLELVLHDPRFHSIQARAVTPRAEPDGRSSVLEPEEPLGKLYCLNVYQTDFNSAAWMPRGSAKKVRMIEGTPCRTGDPKTPPSPGVATPGLSGESVSMPRLAQRRILGEAPVAEDGSFNVEVPANLPIELQLLDDKGIALRSCRWIWTRNHEPQGCIGCHEDPELTPINRLVDAVAVHSISLCPPPEKRRAVSFRRDVMPIIAGKCAVCHAAGGSLPRLDGGEASAKSVYEALLAMDAANRGRGPSWKYVDPGRSRTSPLIWHVFGVNTSRPWDGSAAARPVKPIPAGKSPPLSAEEKAVLVRWIDLGAAW